MKYRSNTMTLSLDDVEVHSIELTVDRDAIIGDLTDEELMEALSDGGKEEVAANYLEDMDHDERRSWLVARGHADERTSPPEIEFRGTHLPHVTGIYVDDEVQGVVIVADDGAYMQLWSGTSFAVPLTRYGTESEAHRIARWLVLGQWAHQEA